MTNLDKVLFPGDPPVTKRELLAYAARIAPRVPALPGGPGAQPAPLSRRRRHRVLAQAAARPRAGLARALGQPRGRPGETTTYLVADEPAALVWAANFGALEWHPWTSRTDGAARADVRPGRPRPGQRTTWDDLLDAGAAAPDGAGPPRRDGPAEGDRQARHPDLDPDRRPATPSTRPAPGSSSCPGRSARSVPELVSWKWEVKARGGLARLDYTQNAINKTLVAPYCPRPAAGAPVSVPIAWDELDDPELRPDRWTIRTVLDRLDRAGDPFRALLGVRPAPAGAAVTRCEPPPLDAAAPRVSLGRIDAVGVRELLLIRHGESDGNVAAAHAHSAGTEEIDVPARDPDVGLSDLGRAQAGAVGTALAELPDDERPEVIGCYPLPAGDGDRSARLRGSGTGAAASRRRAPESPRAWCARPTHRDAEWRRVSSQRERQASLARQVLPPTGGGRSRGQTFSCVCAPGLSDADHDLAGKRVLVVSHDVVILLLRYLCEGLDEKGVLELASTTPLRNAALSRYTRDADGGWTIAAYDEVQHLRARGAHRDRAPRCTS